MLQLIKRCPEYAEGYKAYCQEAYDHHVVFFRPSNPKYLVDDWFERTKEWYDQKEKGLVEGQPVSFHYWAVDDGRFIGEFQLRTEFPPKVMQDIGSVGYAVRVSEWNKGYGTQILRRGLEIAKEHEFNWLGNKLNCRRISNEKLTKSHEKCILIVQKGGWNRVDHSNGI